MARKTLAELDEILTSPCAVKVSHSDRQKGAAYLAIDDVMAEARNVFGAVGYTWNVQELTHDGDYYIARGELTIYPSDAEPIRITRTGISKVKGDGERLVKMVTGAAATAALKACLAQFPHFRLDDEEREGFDDDDNTPAKGGKPAYTGGTKSNGGGGRPSDKQLFHLEKALPGVPESVIMGLDFKEWKPLLDEYFDNDKEPGKQCKAAAVRLKPAPKKAPVVDVDEEDEDDEELDLAPKGKRRAY